MAKKLELTEEQIEEMSYTDIAYEILVQNGKKMKIQDLFKKVITTKKLPSEYFETQIGDFFGLISTDKRFTMLEKGFWDLKTNHVSKVVIEEEEEEEIISEEDEEEEIDDNESIEDNYDDVDDLDDTDDEETVYKDLVIIDENDENDQI